VFSEFEFGHNHITPKKKENPYTFFTIIKMIFTVYIRMTKNENLFNRSYEKYYNVLNNFTTVHMLKFYKIAQNINYFKGWTVMLLFGGYVVFSKGQ
jgi:hypothetical protein